MQVAGQATDEKEAAWPSASLLILNWNGRALLEMCIPPLIRLDYPDYEIVVVDNGSTDDSVSYLRERFPAVRIIETGENLGFSRGMNVGLRRVAGELVLLLNNDVVVRDPAWLRTFVRPLRQNPAVGIAGCKLLFPDGNTIQHAGARLTYPLAYSEHFCYGETDDGHCDERREVPYVTGAAMLIRHALLDKIGLLDEAFRPFYYEEIDLCYRARAAGHKVQYIPDAVALHHESSSIGKVGALHPYTFHRNRLRFVLKHYTPPQFLNDFIPAELERLDKPAGPGELHAARRAYLETALTLPGGEPVSYQNALLGLHARALERQSAPTAYFGGDRDAFLAALADRQSIQEPEFHSDKPVFGPMITTFREAWNSVSTKWYVRPMVEQQQQFNGLVVRLLHYLLDEQNSHARNNSQEIHALVEALLLHQRQSASVWETLTSEMERLGKRVEQLERASGPSDLSGGDE